MYPLFLATNKHHSFVREEIKAVKVVNISRVDQNYTNSSSFDTYVSCDGCLLIVNNPIAVHNIIVKHSFWISSFGISSSILYSFRYIFSIPIVKHIWLVGWNISLNKNAEKEKRCKKYIRMPRDDLQCFYCVLHINQGNYILYCFRMLRRNFLCLSTTLEKAFQSFI